MIKNVLKAFPAFRSKNYRLYFSGQLISLIGTWLQMVAQSWLVLQLTKSAFMVGLVSALGFLPVMFFSLFGGVLVDRFHKRELIIYTQVAEMTLAFILGILTLVGLINVWLVAFLAFLLGIVNAIDMPARQAFTIEMVGRQFLPSAIALNMGVFNTARVIGPALAGGLIAYVGNGGAFIINGLTFLAPIAALSAMRIKSNLPEVHPDTFQAIKIGLRYVYHHSLIKNLLIFTTATAIFGWSYSTIMPVVAQDVFLQDASGLGVMYASAGLGALTGAIFVSGFAANFSAASLILGGNLIFVISVILFSLTGNFSLALIYLFFSGIGLAIQIALLNTTIQHNVEHSLRGRVMSIYSLAFLGMFPLGSFQVGFLAEHFGSQFAIRVGAIILLAFATYLHFSLSKIMFFQNKSQL